VSKKGAAPKRAAPKETKWLPERNFLDRVVNIEHYWCPRRVLPQRGLPQRKRNGCPKGIFSIGLSILSNIAIQNGCCPKGGLPKGLPQRKSTGCPKGCSKGHSQQAPQTGAPTGAPKEKKWLPESNFLDRDVNIEQHWCPQRVLRQRRLPQRKRNGCPKGIFSIGLSILSNIGVHEGCCPKEGV
jgi:hypothetical protein